MKTITGIIRSAFLFSLSFLAGSGTVTAGHAVQASSFPPAFSMQQQGNANGTESMDKTLSPYFIILSDDPETDRLPLKETRALANIAGVIADVTVTQVYTNEGMNVLEAIYVFPASTRAAIYDMRMRVGEREVIALVQEKQHARQLYEQARQDGKTASLLEQMRPNVFQMNVANILPGDVIQVEMKYTELLVPEKGIYSFVYPTVVGPRYSNQSEEEAPSGDHWISNPYTMEGIAPLYDFDIRVNLSTGLPIQEVQSSSHPVHINFISGKMAEVSLEKAATRSGNRDFILQYRLTGGQIESGLLLFEGGEENFFLAMIQPPAKVSSEDIPPREYIFIVDVSGSMYGFPLEISKKLMKELLEGLRTSDRFNILFFAGGSNLFSGKPVPATKENIASAMQMVNDQRGGGGTELLDALKRALNLPYTEGYSRSFVIATDGYVSVEKESFDLIRKNLGKANFFTFGIGSSVNRYLLEGMAHVGMGYPVVLTTEKEAIAGAKKFREYIERPVLTNVRVDIRGFEVYDVEPLSVPDVLAERPVILFGKWRGQPAGTIHLSGISGRKKYGKSIEVSGRAISEINSGLKYLWARERIMLLDDYAIAGEDVKEEVTALGLKYNLLTHYTSFVAIDPEARNQSGNMVTVKQPLPLPEGVSQYAVGGMVPLQAVSSKTWYGHKRAYNEISADHEEFHPLPAETPDDLYLSVEKMPEFEGGKSGFESFMTKNLVYPPSLRSTPFAGKVYVEFVVEADGSVKDIRVARGLHPLLDREAVRVILLSSGKWKPGKQKGKAVRVKMILPVEFRA